MSKKFTTVLCLAIFTISSKAQIFAKWDFNSNPADASTSTGVLTPSFGSGTVALVGGITSTFASGNGGSSSNDNTGLNTTGYPAQGSTSGTGGVEFSVSSLGKTGIVVGWLQRHSNTSSKYLQFQYTTNGTTWTTADLTATNTAGTENGVDYATDVFYATAGDQWSYRKVDLTDIAAVNNNANFKFRIVTVFDPSAPTTYAASGTSYATSGTLRFDDVVIGSNSSLPLAFLSFNAGFSNGSALLNWNTANEIDVKHFEVEKSNDAIVFQSIGTIAAANKAINAYSFIDANIKASAYFRVKTINKNGTMAYTGITKVDVKGSSIQFAVFPNPASERITVSYPLMDSKASIKIVSIEGRLVHQQGLLPNTLSYGLNIAGYAKGSYVVTIEAANGQVYFSRFNKQ